MAGPLGRVAVGGRNWEGFSVDPYLTGILTSETIKGMQDAGTIACLKVCEFQPMYLRTERKPSCQTSSQLSENSQVANLCSAFDR